MTAFDGRLRLLGDTSDAIGVLIDLSDESMVLSTESRHLAEWRFDQIRVFSLPDGFHIRSNDEEVVIHVSDSPRFASELGRRLPHQTR